MKNIKHVYKVLRDFSEGKTRRREWADLEVQGINMHFSGDAMGQIHSEVTDG